MSKFVTGLQSEGSGVASFRGRRAWLEASQWVLRAAEGAVSDALHELELHARRPQRGVQARRMQEVVHRDRAAVSTRPAVAKGGDVTSPAARGSRPAQPAAVAPSSSTRREPIRTRTYARLLAAQGQPQRALAIYVDLMEANPRDVSLAAEAMELRRSLELEQASA